MFDYFWPVVALSLGLFLFSRLLYILVIKPALHTEQRQKELIAGRVAWVMAYDVLHRAFEYSHIKVRYDNLGRHEHLQTVRFLTPLGRRVSLASDESGNDDEDSYLYVWDWSTFKVQPIPVGSIYLELDLCHIPYDHTVDWLIAHKDNIEIQASAVLMNYGVKRVKLQHSWLSDRDQRRVIFRVIYREREKSPAIPQHVDYEEMITMWAEIEAGYEKYNRLERLERDRLIARLLDCGLKEHGGQFPLKKIQAAFAQEISHRQIEAIGQRLEAMGVLEPGGGPKPRKINIEQARAFIRPGE